MLTSTRAAAARATLCAALLLAAAQVQAHAKLIGAEPAANSSVAAPKIIQLKFDEDIAKKFSSVRLTHTGGSPVVITSMVTKDAKSLTALPTAALAPGLYTVSWTAVATDDGHKTMGSYSFAVK